jgi:hypothetical protein
MIDEKFVILGALLSLIGGVSYLIDTLKGIAKPNRISWFFWSCAPLIAFGAEIKQGVGWASLMTFTVGFNPLLVFIASFINKNAYWKITRQDVFCGVLALIGLILWQVTRVGNLAIFFSLMADGLASIPTIIKSYHAPESENWKLYLLAGLNGLITLLTIKNWNFQHYAFPVYILLIDAAVFILVKYRLGKRSVIA